MVYSTGRFVVCLSVCHFVLMFFSPFSIAIISLGEERANLSAFGTFVRFVLVSICRFPLPLGVWEGLRFVIVALRGLFSPLFFHRAFSKFYRRHSALLEKYSVSLKTLLQQGISEPEFYGDLVYRFRKIVGKSNFSEQFRKLINRYKRIGYSLDIMRQTACLVVNTIIVDGYASFFNCTTAARASNSMTAVKL